jgi:hypothetical protein
VSGGTITATTVNSTSFVGALTGNASTATALAAGEQDPQVGGVTSTYVATGNGFNLNAELATDGSGDCSAGAVCLGNHTHSSYLSTESDPQVGGVTADSVAVGNGLTLNAEKAIDATGACAAGSVCGGGHTHTVPRCGSIENLAAADDNWLLASEAVDRTYTEVWCFCNGTCTTMAQFSLEDQAGNAFTMATPTCGTTAAPTATAITTDTVGAYEAVRWDVTNTPSPETDEYMICIN